MKSYECQDYKKKEKLNDASKVSVKINDPMTFDSIIELYNVPIPYELCDKDVPTSVLLCHTYVLNKNTYLKSIITSNYQKLYYNSNEQCIAIKNRIHYWYSLQISEKKIVDLFGN